MAIYLIRHAKAGDRAGWEGDDRLRPLSGPGLEQAAALRDRLAPLPIRRILASPFRRCVQTVEPLAERLGLPVEPAQALAEGAGAASARRVIGSLSGTDAVLCSHGDVIQDLLQDLAGDGVVDPAQAQQLAAGSTWVLEVRGGRIAGARYVPAP